MTTAQQQLFVEQNLPYAESVSESTGLPVDYVLGQAALETGWGTSNAATSGNNYFGISPGGNLATYGSPAAGYDAYATLINTSYPGAASAGDAYSTASYLQGAGYATDPNYATNVSGTAAQVDQILGQSSGGTGYFDPNSGAYYPGNGQGGVNISPPSTSGGSGLGFGTMGQGMMGALPSISQIEELAIRIALGFVGIVLVFGGFYLAASDRRNVNQLVQSVTPSKRWIS